MAVELEEAQNEIWLSPISVWEVLVLAEKDRIRLRPTPGEWIGEAMDRVPIHDAALNREVALTSRRLSLPTQDPADRFIAATAEVFDLTLVTADRRLLEVEGIALLANE